MGNCPNGNIELDLTKMRDHHFIRRGRFVKWE